MKGEEKEKTTQEYREGKRGEIRDQKKVKE